MPELPDIIVLSRSMDQALAGRRIAGAEVNQPKCVNLPPDQFRRRIARQKITGVRPLGKWALMNCQSGGALALNLGMGGQLILRGPGERADPQHERVVLHFAGGEQLWIRFWWFGHLHWMGNGDLSGHPQLGTLGADPLGDDFTADYLGEMLRGRRGAIKRYLLDQRLIAGIGNVYVQDILWHARLHPSTPANSLQEEDVTRLHQAIRHVLREGVRWGGGPREYDLWGNEGRYAEHLQVGYRTGKPCPACGAPVQEIRVASTASYICPRCQPVPQGRT